MLAGIIVAQSAIAMDDTFPCRTIAKACMHAGYRVGADQKRLWLNCIKPTIMNQPVKGVNVDLNTAKACRTHRIDVLQQELKELQSVK